MRFTQKSSSEENQPRPSSTSCKESEVNSSFGEVCSPRRLFAKAEHIKTSNSAEEFRVYLKAFSEIWKSFGFGLIPWNPTGFQIWFKSFPEISQDFGLVWNPFLKCETRKGFVFSLNTFLKSETQLGFWFGLNSLCLKPEKVSGLV